MDFKIDSAVLTSSGGVAERPTVMEVVVVERVVVRRNAAVSANFSKNLSDYSVD